MAEYATRLTSGTDTAARVRMGETLHVLGNGPLEGRAGLRPDGGGAVTVVAGTMDVSVAPFIGWVDGEASDTQGGYPFVCDTDKALTLAAGDVSNARVDLIVARVKDTAYDSSGSTEATVEVVQGDPIAGTVPATPAGSIPLREVNVPAGASVGTGGLSSSNLGTDRRRWTVASGGIIPVVSSTDRDGLMVTAGQTVWRMDTDTMEVWTGTAWVVVGQAATPYVLCDRSDLAGSRNPGQSAELSWTSGTRAPVTSGGASVSGSDINLPAGLYAMTFHCVGDSVSGSSAGSPSIDIKVNGVVVATGAQQNQTFNDITLTASRVVRIADGDVVTAWITQQASATDPWATLETNGACYFDAVWLAP